MADNVSNQIKNLDKWIKDADNSLKHLLDTYTELNRRASNRSSQSFFGTETNKIKEDVTDAQAKIKTLSDEIRKLMQTAGKPKEIEALSKALKDLARSSTSFGSILTTINRSKQVSQSLTNRITQSTNWGMGALSRLNIASAYDAGTSAANRYSTAAKNANVNTSNLLKNARRLASAFGVAFSVQGLVNFGKKLVETRGEFEMQFVAMKQIIGDVDATTKIWNQTMQQALQSPFRAMQLVDYTKKLAAYRIETDKLFDTTKRLADVSAGLGVDMGRLILAYGQVKAANFLRASEVRQFTEAGVNIYGELSKYLSEVNGRLISTAEVAEMVQKRMVSFADVEEIFKRMTDEGGVFFNMQEVQADTVKGQLNKLHDAYDQMLNTIGQANQGAIRDLVQAANDLVRNWRDVASFLKLNATLMLPMIALMRLMKTETYKTIAANTTFIGSMKRLGNSFKYFWMSVRPSNWKNLFASIRGIKPAAVAGAAGMRILDGATRMTVASVELLKGALRTFAPFLLMEGLIWIINKAGEATRAKKQLEEDLSNIRIENSTRVNNEIRNYDKLVKKFNELNQGSLERQEVISKLNSQYGKYIGFEVTEATTLNQLAEAQERVNKSLWENARARAEEEQAQRIEQDFLSREQKLLKADKFTGNTMLSYRNERGVYQYLNPQEAKQFSEYVKVQMPSLTSEVLENADAMQDAMKKWMEAFFGVTVKDFGSTEYSSTIELMNLYVEEEKRLREEQEKLSAEFSGMNAKSLAELTKLNSDISTAIATLTKSKIGEEIDIESLGLKIKVPTDLGEKTGVWEAIKEEINRRKDDFVIDLKFSNELISDEQRDKLKNQAKTTGDLFVDTVNKEIADNILKSSGIEKSLEELKRDIIDNPEQIQDWDAVNHALELTNTHLIKSSDIVNGISTYTKMLAGNLEVGRTAIDDAVRAQGLLVNGTEEEVKKAQEAVDRARERYKWLLRIAKLIGLETKAADEIVAEQGYDLSVGDFRKQNAILAFQEKFGKATNDYGKQLSNIGVTENLKSVADAYHKQDEELQELIKNQEKALENETNLSEAQKRDAQQNIENLKVEQQMAEFLANYFGYVAKQKNTRNSQKESVSSMLSLIKEMNSEYEKLSKSAYGYAKSQKTVSESYRSAFMEIYKGLGMKKGQGMILDFETTDFTTKSGLASAYQKLLDYVSDPKRVGKYAKDAVAQIEKALSQIKAEIDMDVSVRIREDFGRQMEEAFGNYELTLDLQKLNLPSDVLEDMFGMESVTLDQIRQKIGDWYESMRKDGYSLISETDYKEVEKYLKKVDDLERKQQRERIKDYAKYLEYEMSERAKISMDYTRKIAEVQAETAFKPEQRERIINGLKKEMGEKLAQQDWEDFKGTEVYVQMMEDLEKHGTAALTTMRQELEKVRENAENLSPRALKEVVNAIEKIKEIELDRSTPFVNVAEARKEFQLALKEAGVTSAKELFKQADALEKQRVELSRQRMELEGIVGAQREYYDATKKLDKINEQSWARKYLNAEDTDEAILADYETAIANRKANDEELKNLAVQRASADEDGTKVIDEQVQSINTETNAINIQIERLKEWMRLRGIVYGIDPSLLKNGNAESDLTNVTTQLETTENKQGTVNKAVNAYDRLGKSIKKTIDYVKNLANTVNPLFDNIMDNLDYLGGETNTLTAGWKEFGDTMVSAITDISSAMELIQKVQEEMAKEGLATSLMSGNLVAAAVAVLGVLIKIVSAIGRLHDARLDRSIEKVQERIDALKDAYARLEKQIEKTWSSVSYVQTYEQQMQNIRDQIEAIESQMNAERAKKNTDENAVLQYQRDIQDAYDQLDELQQKSIEVFGGIGEEGYRSAAEGFVEAWKSAFLETGDGLQGLQDHFDEFLQEWFVKQATMRIAGGMLEPVFRQIDAAVDKYGEGGTSAMLSEIERVRDMAAAIFPDLSLALEDLAGMFGVGGEGSLSGLAAGIQGMTEEQANILEAYWNSVRMYTASIDMNVSRIAEMLGVGGPSSNPMLAQLQTIAENTRYIKDIYTMLDGTRRNLGNGQGFVTYNQ